MFATVGWLVLYLARFSVVITSCITICCWSDSLSHPIRCYGDRLRTSAAASTLRQIYCLLNVV